MDVIINITAVLKKDLWGDIALLNDSEIIEMIQEDLFETLSGATFQISRVAQ